MSSNKGVRDARLDAAISAARAGATLGLLAGGAGVACFLVGATRDEPAHFLLLSLIPLATVLAAGLALRANSARLAILVAIGLIGQMATIIAELGRSDVLDHDRIRMLTVASLLFSPASILCLLLAGLKLLRPVAAMFLFGSLATSITTGIVVINAVRPDMAVKVVEPTAGPDMTGPSTPPPFDTRLFPPIDGPLGSWPINIGQGFENDESLGFRLRRDFLVRDLYPINPGDYFRAEPIYGAIEVNQFNVYSNSPNDGSTSFRKKEGILRAIPGRNAGASDPFDVFLRYDYAPVEKDRVYWLSFVARADRPRAIQTRINRRDAPWTTNSPPTIHRLTTTFTKHYLKFIGRETANVWLHLSLNDDAAPVEIKELAFAPTDTNAGDALIDRKGWKQLATGEDAPATSSVDQSSGSVTFTVPPSADRRVALFAQDVFSLKSATKVALRVKARGEPSCSAKLHLINSSSPREKLGLGLDLPLAASSQTFTGTVQIDLVDHPVAAMLEISTPGSRVVLEECQILAAEIADPGPSGVPSYLYGVRLETNSHGFRDRERTLRREPNVLRIACLGDSCTQGQAVHEHDTFSRKLEESLNAKRGDRDPTYEILNFGVKGYCTDQEVRLFESVACRFDPNVVVITMIHNDNQTVESTNQKQKRRTESAARIFKMFNLADSLFGGAFDYSPSVESLLRLRALCDAKRIKLVVAIMQDSPMDNWRYLDQQVRAGLKGAGVPIFNYYSEVKDIPFSSLVAHPTIDPHPSARAHATFAAFLEARLRSLGYLTFDKAARGP